MHLVCLSSSAPQIIYIYIYMYIYQRNEKIYVLASGLEKRM